MGSHTIVAGLGKKGPSTASRPAAAYAAPAVDRASTSGRRVCCASLTFFGLARRARWVLSTVVERCHRTRTMHMVRLSPHSTTLWHGSPGFHTSMPCSASAHADCQHWHWHCHWLALGKTQCVEMIGHEEKKKMHERAVGQLARSIRGDTFAEQGAVLRPLAEAGAEKPPFTPVRADAGGTGL